MYRNHKFIYLKVSPVNDRNSSEIDSLARKYFKNVSTSALPETKDSEKVHCDFIVINYLAIQPPGIKERVLPKIRNHRTIIINAPRKEQTSVLLTLGHIRGYFLSDENSTTFWTGLARIKQGEFHLPEPINTQLLHYYQSVLLRHTQPLFTNLTQREVEVLQYLKDGVSNNRLADQLFISEHTVKSHLYKIFRKLKIKNRTQAIEWAHKFLP